MKNTFLKIFRQNRYIFLYGITERLFFFGFFLIIAREYSQESFGQLITVLAIANILVTAIDFGLPALLQKDISLSAENGGKLTSNALLIFFLALPFYTGFCYLINSFFAPVIDMQIFFTAIFSVYILSAANLLNKALSGLHEFGVQLKALFISRIICFVFIFALISGGYANLNTLILVLVIAGILQIIFLIPGLKNNSLFPAVKDFNLSYSLNLLKLSLPLGIAVLFNFLYDKIDILLISIINGFEQVAYYNIGYGIFKSSFILISYFYVSGLTRVSALSKRKNAVNLFFRKYLRILFAVSVILTLMLFLFSDLIIRFLYTDKFEESVFILKILSLAVTGVALNNLTGIILTGAGFFKTNMYITLTGVGVNILLNVLFLPRYGIAAAAVITVITEYFIFVSGYFSINKFLKT